MKKLLTISLITLILTGLTGATLAETVKPWAFPFIGRWQPTDDPLLIDDYGLADIQNLRREGKHLKGVQGHTKINQTSINTVHNQPRAGFHFIKNNPAESHVILQAFDSEGAQGQLYNNTTTIPNMGEFSGTTLHGDAPNADKGRFASIGPDVAYCNQKESLIWGGEEMAIAGFLLHPDFNKSPADYWDKVLYNDTDTYVVTGGATRFYVGSNRRINQVKVYVKTANASAAVTAVSEYCLGGATFQAVSNLTDNTSAGGAALAVTGVISWDYNTNTRATFVEDGDILAYWYQFEIPSLDATTAIYYVTCGEGEFRRVEDLWDGAPIATARFWFKKTGVSDFTDEINEALQISYAKIKDMTTTDEIVVGYSQKMRGFEVGVVNSYGNAVVSGVSVAYWGGEAWSGVTGLYDGTKGSDYKTISQDGMIHFIPSEEMSTEPLEVKRTYNSNELLYYYRIMVGVNLTSDTRIYYVAGIPAQPAKGDFKLVDKYRFPVSYQGRFFMFGHENECNRGVYSAFEQPDVFNGTDSGGLIFGDRQALTSGGVVYNIFRTTAYEQLILTKSSETWRLAGDGPENWVIARISPNVGCVAPLSFAVCDVVDTEQGKRNVAIWQAAHGFVRCDGAAPEDISDDIKIYFDKNHPDGIAKHRIDDTQAWYDPDTQEYCALISSGAETADTWGNGDTWGNAPVEAWGTDWSNPTTIHNTELHYSLKYNEWTKIARYEGGATPTALPLQVGFQTKDSDGKIYAYGAANNGIMYRLENGNTWDGTTIKQYAKTKDILVDGETPLAKHTTFEKLRLMFTAKSGTTPSENITIEHWGDGIETITGVSGETMPGSIWITDTYQPHKEIGRDTQSVRLGPNLRHAFKFESTNSLNDGMELLGIAGLYNSFDTWKN